MVKALVDLGVIKTTGDSLTIKRAIAYFIDNISRQTERQETIAVRAPPPARPFGQQREDLP